LGPGERQRWRDRPRPPDRRVGCASAHHAAVRPQEPPPDDRAGYSVPGWRQRRGPQRGDALMPPLSSPAPVPAPHPLACRRAVAFAVGRLAGDGKRWGRLALGLVAGLALIHLGGLAQLLILTGSAASAVRLGTVPFLLGDLLKLCIAILILRPTVSPLRARL